MTDDFLFGDVAVQEGFVTRAQVEEAARARNGRPLSEVLVARGWLNADQVRLIRHIGRIHAVERGDSSETGVLRQDRLMLPCPSCDTYYLVQGLPEGVRFHCRKCRTELTVRKPVPGPAPDASLPAGRKLGPYSLVGEIDRGSAGVVYKAVHLESGRTVALKVLRDSAAPDPARLERFRQEAAALRRVSHPNIVAVHDAGEADGSAYLALDYVEGTTLDRALAQGRLRLREFLEILEQVALAVHHAHQLGIVHRDLKPANIILDAAGKPHVTDFGLAKMEQAGKSVTHTGASLGTPHYMSPEQVQGDVRGTDARSDIYALGVLLYQALAGRLPYPGNSVVEVYRRVLSGPPEPPSRFNPKAPADLEAACLRALQREKEARQASAAEFAAEIRRHLGLAEARA